MVKEIPTGQYRLTCELDPLSPHMLKIEADSHYSQSHDNHLTQTLCCLCQAGAADDRGCAESGVVDDLLRKVVCEVDNVRPGLVSHMCCR